MCSWNELPDKDNCLCQYHVISPVLILLLLLQVVILPTLVLGARQIVVARMEPSVMPQMEHATVLLVSLVLHVPQHVLQTLMVQTVSSTVLVLMGVAVME